MAPSSNTASADFLDSGYKHTSWYYDSMEGNIDNMMLCAAL